MGIKSSTQSKDHTVLTEDEIKILLDNTSFDREQIQDWHQGFLKDCPTGRMNRDKFISFYSQMYPAGRADKFCKQVFKVFDANNSGEIDFSELMMAISITTIGDTKKKILLAFKLYDLDKNDKIDTKEMENVIESMYDLLMHQLDGDLRRTGYKSPNELVKSIMIKFDKNDDKFLSKDEFIEGCLADPDIRELLVPYA